MLPYCEMAIGALLEKSAILLFQQTVTELKEVRKVQ